MTIASVTAATRIEVIVVSMRRPADSEEPPALRKLSRPSATAAVMGIAMTR